MNKASSVEVAAWSDGKAPNTMGEAVNPEVYKSMPKKGINACQTGWRALHRVVCWRQTIHVLVPRRGARE